MAIEAICTGCGRTLRVSDHDAGRQARCPICNAISLVPRPVSAGSPSGAALRQWHLKTPDGVVYGPVGQDDLESWIAEGRVTDTCELRAAEDGPWQAADAIYPVLRKPLQPAPAMASIKSSYIQPHRGALILILGVLGWVASCPVFSVIAWSMGTADLRDMRAGRMDEAGMGLTQAGQILGMIYTLIWAAVLVVALSIGALMMLAA